MALLARAFERRELRDPGIFRAIFSNTWLAPILLFLRLYLGYQWLIAGSHKVWGGERWIAVSGPDGQALRGYWERQIAIPEQGRPPISFDWYRDFLTFMLDHEWYRWFSWVIAIGEVALGVLLIVGAFVGVAALFGDQWAEAVPVLKVMAVFSLIGSIGVNAGDVYKALGRTGVLARLSALELIALVPALLIGARHGLVGVAWAHAAVAAVDTTIRLAVANRMVHTSFGDVWRQVAPSLAAGVWMAAAVVPVLWMTGDATPFVSLLAATAAGSLAYGVALWRIDPVVIQRILGFVGLRRGKARP